MKVKIKPDVTIQEGVYGNFASGSIVDDSQVGGDKRIVHAWVGNGWADVVEEDVVVKPVVKESPKKESKKSEK